MMKPPTASDATRDDQRERGGRVNLLAVLLGRAGFAAAGCWRRILRGQVRRRIRRRVRLRIGRRIRRVRRRVHDGRRSAEAHGLDLPGGDDDLLLARRAVGELRADGVIARFDVDGFVHRRLADHVGVDGHFAAGRRAHVEATELRARVGEALRGVGLLVALRVVQILLEELRGLEVVARLERALREVEEHRGVLLERVRLLERGARGLEVSLVERVDALLETGARGLRQRVVLRALRARDARNR